ncbi:MAG: class I SAM-dependent methyltransferase [Myxococcales bacterium]|nr:class I SAM-dependent methyltransferase [Myxococcales bacterium]
MQLDTTSLERLVPDELRSGDVTGEEALRISLERYRFAAQHVRPGRLLDLACGVGYGTRFLTDRAEQLTTALGVDLSESAVAYATERYANERTGFLSCDAMQFEDAECFDTIVSIETIEHLPDPEGFVEHLIGLLRPGGHLIGSVPITPSVDANPHHLHDFTDRSFRRLVGRHGLEVLDSLVQHQSFGLRAVLTRSEARLESMRRNLPAWYLRHPGALLRRVVSTLRHGFVNRYLTIAWRLPG